MANDLKKCYDAIKDKTYKHNLRWRYYTGEHPIAFVNPKINEVIPNSVVFKKNWCEVIINTSRDRLKIDQWEPENLAGIWKKVIRRTSNDIHVTTLAMGEAYLIAWPDVNTGKLRAFFHDPRQVHVLYEDDDPDTPRVACKIWQGEEDGKTRHYLNLYYPDAIEHYVAENEPYSSAAYQPAETPVEANPYGTIPVFHFRVDRRRGTGELTPGIISLQDAMNKLLNDMMVASEYTSFPQRWGIGNFDDSKMAVSPASFLKIPPAPAGVDQPVSVGAFPTTPPGNYLEPMGALANDMAVLSATPKHYFDGQGANISGEALQAMEAPLIAKIEIYQDSLGETWEDVMRFAAAVENIQVDENDIEAIWQDAHTVQPKSEAETWKIKTEAGIPIKNVLRDEGWTDEQLEQLDADGFTPTGPPLTPEQAQPRFEGVVQTPDIGGQLAQTGAVSRAVNRRVG